MQWKKVYRRRLLRWGNAAVGLALSIGAGVWFLFSLNGAWKADTTREHACTLGDSSQNSWVQFEVFEQDPIEPLFRGNIVMSFSAKDVPTGAKQVSIGTGAGNGYFGNLDEADLSLQKGFGAFATPKPVTTEFVRASGSHRDFPFDSADLDFEMAWNPPIPAKALILRNYNQSFLLPCKSVSIRTLGDGKLEFSFKMKRSPLVQVSAAVLLSGAVLFVVAIGCFVKLESLPTAIASYFFSLWSVRSILSSEMKTFPTFLDITILSLSVALVVMVGIRLAIHIRPKKS